MTEYDALKGYPKPSKPRLVSSGSRTISHRIVASRRGKEYFDGDRSYGYGGYSYDGRWVPIVENICSHYDLDSSSSVLQVGSEKGFILHDLLKVMPGITVTGTEPSEYARKETLESVKSFVIDAPYDELPFEDTAFDLVFSLGPVYTLDLSSAMKCLSEIERVGKGKSFVTLGSYTNWDDYWLFKHWTLLGTTILKPEEWLEVIEEVGYTGDYKFTGATSLGLVRSSHD